MRIVIFFQIRKLKLLTSLMRWRIPFAMTVTIFIIFSWAAIFRSSAISRLSWSFLQRTLVSFVIFVIPFGITIFWSRSGSSSWTLVSSGIFVFIFPSRFVIFGSVMFWRWPAFGIFLWRALVSSFLFLFLLFGWWFLFRGFLFSLFPLPLFVLGWIGWRFWKKM